MAISEARKRANAKWDRANTKMVSCKLNLEQYSQFQRYAEQNGKTVSGMVKQLVMDCISDTEQKKDRRVIFHFRGEDYLGFSALLEQLRSVGYDGSEHIVRNYLYKGRIGAESLKKYPMIAEISTEQQSSSQETTEQQNSDGQSDNLQNSNG